MESNGLHDLQKMESQSFFFFANNIFPPLFLDTFKYIEAPFNFLSTDKYYVFVDKSILKIFLNAEVQSTNFILVQLE